MGKRVPVKDYKIKHVSSGLADYTYGGETVRILVKKKTLDQMNPSFKRKPVFIGHRDAKIDAASAVSEKVGEVYDVGYDPDSESFFVNALIWDEEAQKLIESGQQPSNAYYVGEYGPASTYNNVPYDKEVLQGEYDHLAIVSNPRYDNTEIQLQNSLMLQNSQDPQNPQNSKPKTGGLIMNRYVKKAVETLLPKTVDANKTATPQVVQNAVSPDEPQASPTGDPQATQATQEPMVALSTGGFVTLAEAMSSVVKAREKAKNEAPAENILTPDFVVDVDGEPMTAQEIADIHEALVAADYDASPEAIAGAGPMVNSAPVPQAVQAPQAVQTPAPVVQNSQAVVAFEQASQTLQASQASQAPQVVQNSQILPAPKVQLPKVQLPKAPLPQAPQVTAPPVQPVNHYFTTVQNDATVSTVVTPEVNIVSREDKLAAGAAQWSRTPEERKKKEQLNGNV